MTSSPAQRQLGSGAPFESASLPTPTLACTPHPPAQSHTVLKLGKRLSGVVPLKWKASKCFKSSGGCRGRVGRVREASRGLGVLEARPAAEGRRAESEMRSHRALCHLCCQNKRLLYSQDRNS